jgi:hypothetical protein
MLYAKISEDFSTILKWPLTENQLRYEIGIALPDRILETHLINTGYIAVGIPAEEDILKDTLLEKVNLSNELEKTETGWKRKYVKVPVSEFLVDKRKEAKLSAVKSKRDKKMNAFEWRIARYNRDIRNGNTPVDNIIALDKYMQDLADITLQEDYFNIVWPIIPE